MKEISIIVPVYNAEKYITRCVNSLINQTYNDYEIILVDDGSTDNSLNVCKELSSTNKQIRVCHQENRGAGGARNTGLSLAQGNFVCFIDADDWVDNTFLFDSINLINKYSVDMVITDLSPQKEDTVLIRDINSSLNSFFRIHGEKDTHSICGILIRRNILQGFHFIENRMNEDVMASYEFCKRSKLSVYTTRNYYHYFHNSEGVTNSKFTYKRVDLLFIWKSLIEVVKKEFPDYLYACEMNYYRAHLTLLLQMTKMGYDKKDLQLKELKKDLKKVIRSKFSELLNWSMPISRKIALCFFWLF